MAILSSPKRKAKVALAAVIIGASLGLVGFALTLESDLWGLASFAGPALVIFGFFVAINVLWESRKTGDRNGRTYAWAAVLLGIGPFILAVIFFLIIGSCTFLFHGCI